MSFNILSNSVQVLATIRHYFEEKNHEGKTDKKGRCNFHVCQDMREYHPRWGLVLVL